MKIDLFSMPLSFILTSHDKDIADLINHARNKLKTFLFGLLLGSHLGLTGLTPKGLSCTSGPTVRIFLASDLMQVMQKKLQTVEGRILKCRKS